MGELDPYALLDVAGGGGLAAPGLAPVGPDPPDRRGRTMGERDPYALLDVAVEVALAAADLAQARRAEGVGEIGTKSTATDVVTAADRAVEHLITQLLREQRPGD